jgi:hypothetical protein
MLNWLTGGSKKRARRESQRFGRAARKYSKQMKTPQRQVRMLKSLRVPLPLTGGEVSFYIGQLAMVDSRLADLWIQRGIAEAIANLDDLRAVGEQAGVGTFDFHGPGRPGQTAVVVPDYHSSSRNRRAMRARRATATE